LGLAPRVVLGHSLGEYAAWVAAGALAYDDAVRLVRQRGQLMQEAVPVGVGAMSAIIAAPTALVEQLCEEARSALPPGKVVEVAVYNCPGNVVVSGHTEGVEAVERNVEEGRHGVVRRLAVSAPFHCSLLAPAAERLAEVLSQIEVHPNDLPVIPNVTAEVVEPGAEPDLIRELLVRQVQAPVRWETSLRHMLEMGVNRALSLGPGTMNLAQLKRVRRRMPMVSL
ncbi:MAG: ACP S-malonyltransferase, partial [Myxococcota bacterium]